MPQIKPYETQTNVPGAVGGGRTFVDRGPNALQTVGKMIQTAANDAADYWEQKELNDANYAAAKANTDWANKYEEMKKTAPEDGSGFAENFQKQYDAWKGEQLNKFSSAKAQMVLSDHLESVKGAYTNHAIQYQAKLNGQFQTKREKDQIQEDLNAIKSNPSILKQTLSSMEMRIRSNSYFTENHLADEYLAEAKRRAYDTYQESRVSSLLSNPKKTMGQIDGLLKEMKAEKSELALNMDAESFKTQVNRLDAAKEHLSSEQRQLYLLNAEDVRKQTAETGVRNKDYSEENIKARVPEGYQREKLLKEFREAESEGKAKKELRGKTLQEISDSVKNARKEYETHKDASTLGEKEQILRGVESAGRSIVVEYLKDPAAYNAQYDPTVKSIYEILQREDLTEEQRAFHRQNLNKAQKVAQERMRPGVMPSLLTDSERDAIDAQIKSAPNTPNGVDLVLSKLDALKREHGYDYPLVVRDLSSGEKPVLNSTHKVAADIENIAGATYVRRDLIQAGSMSPKDLVDIAGSEEKYRVVRKNVEGTLNEFKSVITADGSAASAKVYDDYIDAFTKYHLFKKGTADSVSDLKTLYDVAIRSKYEMVDNGAFKYRINKSKTNDFDSVKYGVEKFVSDIVNGKTEVVPPKDTRPNILPEQSREEYINKISSKNNLKVVSTGDEKGIRVLDHQGNEVFIKDKNGIRRARITIEEAERLGKE